MNESEVEQSLNSLEGWQREGEAISREFELANFDAAIELVNAVAGLARERDHHPDILLHDYKRLKLTLSTHSEGGITANDIELARAINEILRG